MGLENRLIGCLSEYDALMNDLLIVQELNLPQCFIAAGYIRNYVWDRLHGWGPRETHEDIDVVYYDADEPSEARDRQLTQALVAATGNRKWSVKNQARMHMRNHAEPYRSTADAMSRWPETVTAIGARRTGDGRIEICAPHGLEDLFGMVVRRSPLFTDKDYFLERVRKKGWKKKWPRIDIVAE